MNQFTSTFHWEGLRSKRFANNQKRHLRARDQLNQSLYMDQPAAVTARTRRSPSPSAEYQFRPCFKAPSQVVRTDRPEGKRIVSVEHKGYVRKELKHYQQRFGQDFKYLGIKTFRDNRRISFECERTTFVEREMGLKRRPEDSDFKRAAGTPSYNPKFEQRTIYKASQFADRFGNTLPALQPK